MIAADGGAEACEENEGGTMGVDASDTYDYVRYVRYHDSRAGLT